MSPRPPVRVVLLDVNETLTVLEPLAQRFTDVGAPAHLLPTWFASALRDGFALAATGACPPFRDVAGGALAELLVRHGVEEVPAAVRHVLEGFGDLDLHPDVPDGLRAARDAGLAAVPFTNGATAVSDGAFRRAGVEDLLTARLSVADAGAWKPVDRAYRWAAEQVGASPQECALVAVHPWDLHGAARAGLTSAWLDRRGTPWPPSFDAPHVRGATLPEVVAALAER